MKGTEKQIAYAQDLILKENPWWKNCLKEDAYAGTVIDLLKSGRITPDIASILDESALDDLKAKIDEIPLLDYYDKDLYHSHAGNAFMKADAIQRVIRHNAPQPGDNLVRHEQKIVDANNALMELVGRPERFTYVERKVVRNPAPWKNKK